MKKKSFICSLLILNLIACKSQDSKSMHPCAGKYGSDKVITRIKDRFNLQKALIVFNEYYKDPKRIPNNCDTIHLDIDANSSLLSQDTFAISVANFFFSDSSNFAVKALYLDTKERWPAVGDVTTKYVLSREDVNNYNGELTMPSNNVENPEYEIIQKASVKGKGIKGLSIIAKLPNDVNDPRKLAEVIKDRYRQEIRDKKLTQFTIELRVVSPFCKLCMSKIYTLFFEKNNGNL